MALLQTVATTVYLLVNLTGPINQRPEVHIKFRTADKAACEAQAAQWNKVLEEEKARFACLPHAQRLFHGTGAQDTGELD